MKFSVVIPLYNKALYLQRALDSVLAQTVQDFEIVVVDDGSTDDGANLVRAYQDPRIRLIQQANAGAAAARNRGVAESNADLIAFLDADDQWDQDFLEQIYFLTEEYPTAGLFATSYRISDGTKTQYPQISELAIPLCGHGILDNYLKVVLGPAPFFTSSTVARKEILQKVGGFPVGIALGEDLDTWLRIYLHSTIAFMYVHPVIYFTALSSSASAGYVQEIWFSPIQTAQEFLSSDFCTSGLAADIQEYIAHCELQLAKSKIYHHRHEQARTHLLNIKKTERYRFERNLWIFWTFMPDTVTRMAFHTKAFFRKFRSRFEEPARARSRS
jgi:glycosyltransferase involved in cell wall biosynthesis